MFYRLIKKERLVGSGFTLIELLVVIAIIGILASIVLASLNSARKKSRDTRRLTDIKQLQVALEFYFDGVGNANYPPALTTCTTSADTGPDSYYGLEVLSTNGYIPSVTRDPQSGVTDATAICYNYSAPTASTKTTYHLGATMEDSGNQALNSDKDCVSSGTATCVSGVTAYDNGFDGTAATKYDVIP